MSRVSPIPASPTPASPEPAPPHWRDAILDSIADGVFTVDGDWRLTYLNPAAERITGTEQAHAVGRYCFEVFRASICEGGCCLREALKTGEPQVHKAAYVVGTDGRRVPISISASVLRDEQGQVIGGVETFRDLGDVEALRRELRRSYEMYDIVSKSEPMLRLLRVLPQIAGSESTVLIEGESGTGKELLARAVHGLSPRRDGPWVAVNCAALPDTLLESELFGHVAGAFTDARRGRRGRFEAANGGTIFLDEIGDISPAMQTRLLRVLQERVVEPVGSSSGRPVDFRVVAATNKRLADLAATGELREDLYYRLAVLPLEVPPLRERREDIPLLVEHFIGHFNRLKGREVAAMAPQALALLMEHDFPGNVRELMNAVEHAFALCSGGVLLPEHLPAHLRGATATPAPAPGPGGRLVDAERRAICDALAENDYDRRATAEALGVHTTTLWRKMRQLGIEAAPSRARARRGCR